MRLEEEEAKIMGRVRSSSIGPSFTQRNKRHIMRKDMTTTELTKIEIERNKKISTKGYIRFQPGGFQARGLNSALV